jgi:hypothetical protein
MKDGIGQTITVGDTVVRCGGRYASAATYQVVKLSESMVGIDKSTWHQSFKQTRPLTHVWPDTLVVVTKLLPVPKA